MIGEVCPVCGTDARALLTRGLPGCTNCYGVHRPIMGRFLSPDAVLLPTGASDHGLAQAARRLRRADTESRLRQALEREDYLEARRLRDVLREVSP